MPNEQEILDFQYEAALETVRMWYPKIASSIEFTWGYKECLDYMQESINESSSKEFKDAVLKLIEIYNLKFKGK